MKLLKLLSKAIGNLNGDLNRHQKASLRCDSVAEMPRSAVIVTHCIAVERTLVSPAPYLELLESWCVSRSADALPAGVRQEGCRTSTGVTFSSEVDKTASISMIRVPS